jgi:uncharacterized repeat protein (TIGR01451 family)
MALKAWRKNPILWRLNSVRIAILYVLVLVWTGFLSVPAHAQIQRSFINTGFESNDPQGPGAANFQILNDDQVPGWEATTDEIELWDSNFLSVPAFEGIVFAEMNANQPGALFQEVCLINGDRIRWSFAHRARSGGAATQTAQFQIANQSGAVLQTLATQASTTSQGWNVNQNLTTGVAYTGTSGLRRVQFTTTNSGSVGNFLDGIQIFLNPFVEFSASNSSGIESVASTNLASLYISGAVQSAFSVSVQVTGGTATLSSDYSTPNGSNNFVVNIPAGNYNQTAVPLGINITNDSLIEGSETIALSITPVPANYTIANSDVCGASARSISTYTIIDDDARLTLRKQWSGAATGDEATLQLMRGGAMIDSLLSEAGSPNELDTDPSPAAVVIGETLSLTEILAPSNLAQYQGSIACTGTADNNFADGLTIGAGETAIICSFTNIRSGIAVTKTSEVILDGFNAANPKAIPGATIQYCLQVVNDGLVSAGAVSVVDQLPANLSFVAGSIVTGTNCANAALPEDEDALGGDESDPYGVSVSDDIISGMANVLAAGDAFAIVFSARLE